MEHADVWYEVAEQKIQLALILEDDAIFVPFFKEKFTRMIYTAINTGILHLNETCVKPKEKSISNNERINQNAVIFIGICANQHGQGFEKKFSNATPFLSTRKSNAWRCSHAYLLTSCSAQALIDQIQAQKNKFWHLDRMQASLIRSSPTLQTFWMDPPLAYQGNKVIDLDNIQTFKRTTYK
jgi:GR25 family glycosyltransferase involved in LPS biosynthesis